MSLIQTTKGIDVSLILPGHFRSSGLTNGGKVFVTSCSSFFLVFLLALGFVYFPVLFLAFLATVGDLVTAGTTW